MVKIVGELQEHKEVVATFLSDRAVSDLVKEIQEKYGEDPIIKIDDTLESQGAYDWGSSPPSIFLNPLTGLNKENLCHEMVHVLQFSEDFFIVSSAVYRDLRKSVVKELNSNILHIHLTSEFRKRKISSKKYLISALQRAENALKKRTPESIKNFIPLRLHYDAIFYLRIVYEANFLTKAEKRKWHRMYLKYAPNVFPISASLQKIINKTNALNPDGAMEALLNCLQYLDSDLAARTSEYGPSPYKTSIDEIKEHR